MIREDLILGIVHACIHTMYPIHQLLDNYKRMYNLSEEEIEAIQKELDEHFSKYTPKAQSDQLDLFKYNPDDYKRIYEPFEKEPEKTKEEQKKPSCTFHKWKTYTGLKEVFEYCEVCDERKK